MKFSRRNFLQNASLSIASLGGFWGNISLSKYQLNAYGETLKSSASRKLALLVGINQYSQGKNLRGCTTDVELQKKLLIYHFGFSPDNIITLVDREATRENILTAFEEHLIKRAENNDVVIFHFSGYGRQIKLNNDDNNSTTVNSLITYDSIKSHDNIVEDILLDTFLQLGTSLKTNKYTFIFDTSFISSSVFITHELTSRSYPFNTNLFISQEEVTFNKNLQKNSQNKRLKNKKNNLLSGLIITPFRNNLAIEINSTNFNVGLFTYCLTQSLWENLPLTDNLSLMKKVASQITLYTGKSETFNFYGDLKNSILPYHLSLDSFSQGNAIITNIIEPNIIELELLSLPLLVLLNYGLNSCFIANLGEEKKVTIQINSLVGNKAKGILINSNKNLVYKGLILRESLRIIKRNTTLNIALNDSLEKIEKVDATSALSAISEIESVVNLGDNFADLVFGKVNDKKTMIDGYGLFTSSEVLLVNTYPKVDNEAVSSAIKHLIPSLKIALAEKLLQLTSNQYSSLLSVNINVEISHNDKIINIQEQTSYSNYQPIKNPFQKYSNNDQNLLIEIPFDSQLTITINNENNHNLYYLLVGINSSRQAISYFSPDEIIINSLDNITIPKHKSSLKWSMNTDKAISKLMLICSKSPFNQTLNQLYKNPNLKPDIEQIILLDNPVIIAKAILEDLHLGSNISNNIINNLNDVYALDLSHWVTFNLTYKVV
ncbi:peptidase C14 [Geminocystis sp. NIES-3708]|uniref:caspase family protein n=1 Tax=Geminocystis sp. NIES-3708 TaxID=1615909 RepID=UPI0005FC72E4|nr:caspase family protein [Geminocystis sp. NIES-3708]BAQ61317.1 peptidase C14 [Geminocystis sp. NIES-3708]